MRWYVELTLRRRFMTRAATKTRQPRSDSHESPNICVLQELDRMTEAIHTLLPLLGMAIMIWVHATCGIKVSLSRDVHDAVARIT